MATRKNAWIVLAVLVVAACAGSASLPFSAGVGPSPQLPEPHKELIPGVHIAEASGWPANTMPAAAQGLRVTAFATGLSHPRWLHVLPNGDVLVAETDGPSKEERPNEFSGFKAKIMAYVMKRAGS